MTESMKIYLAALETIAFHTGEMEKQGMSLPDALRALYQARIDNARCIIASGRLF